MKLFVGLDISLNKTTVCIMDDGGKTVLEGTALSDSEDLAAKIDRWRDDIELIGLEACPLSEWIYGGLIEAGYDVRCLEPGTRSASSQPGRTRPTAVTRTVSPP